MMFEFRFHSPIYWWWWCLSLGFILPCNDDEYNLLRILSTTTTTLHPDGAVSVSCSQTIHTMMVNNKRMVISHWSITKKNLLTILGLIWVGVKLHGFAVNLHCILGLRSSINCLTWMVGLCWMYKDPAVWWNGFAYLDILAQELRWKVWHM